MPPPNTKETFMLLKERVANLAGFLSPSLVGWLNDFTGKQGAGLMLTSGVLLVGACLLVLVPKQAVDR
jgi:MFS-type transporter involved in bile tolerance (Atg22 family)